MNPLICVSAQGGHLGQAGADVTAGAAGQVRVRGADGPGGGGLLPVGGRRGHDVIPAGGGYMLGRLLIIIARRHV